MKELRGKWHFRAEKGGWVLFSPDGIRAATLGPSSEIHPGILTEQVALLDQWMTGDYGKPANELLTDFLETVLECETDEDAIDLLTNAGPDVLSVALDELEAVDVVTPRIPRAQQGKDSTELEAELIDIWHREGHDGVIDFVSSLIPREEAPNA